MGYYTYYECTVYDNKYDAIHSGKTADIKYEIEAAEALARMPYFNMSDAQIENIRTVRSPMEYVVSGDSMKWYDHDDDMLKLSKMFPHLWFRLYGEGEEHFDMWYGLYHAGESSSISIETKWPEFEDKWILEV